MTTPWAITEVNQRSPVWDGLPKFQHHHLRTSPQNASKSQDSASFGAVKLITFRNSPWTWRPYIFIGKSQVFSWFLHGQPIMVSPMLQPSDRVVQSLHSASARHEQSRQVPIVHSLGNDTLQAARQREKPWLLQAQKTTACRGLTFQKVVTCGLHQRVYIYIYTYYTYIYICIHTYIYIDNITLQNKTSWYDETLRPVLNIP